jgi:TRAP-type C4-dicarboxylate transport system permease small subunit
VEFHVVTQANEPNASPDARPLIAVDETVAEPKIRFFAEDLIAFAVFWVLAAVVFLQFFTRYVLNDSMSWTEEIARYLLMWLTFIGSAVVARRGLHISVEALLHFLPSLPAAALRFCIDIVTLLFVVALCFFSIAITQRMQIQTMMVVEWPMSIVYGGIAFGCFLMLYRCARRIAANARRRWQPDPEQAELLID